MFYYPLLSTNLLGSGFNTRCLDLEEPRLCLLWISVWAALASRQTCSEKLTGIRWDPWCPRHQSVAPLLSCHTSHTLSAQSISRRDSQLFQSRGTERESTGIMNCSVFTVHWMHASQLAVIFYTHRNVYADILWHISSYQQATKKEETSALCAWEVMQ